jgi:hypothetical protein
VFALTLFSATQGHAGVMKTRSSPEPPLASRHRYLVEIHLPIEADVSWAGRSLHAACLRLSSGGRLAQVLSVVYRPADQRLSSIVAAACREDVRELFEMALLPPARVLEEVEG